MPTILRLRRLATPFAVMISLAQLGTVAHAQLVAGQVDDFESGLAGWQSGAANPNPPSLALNAGPGGAGDDAMQLTAVGGFLTPGRTLVAFNTAQWSGDYLGTGVSSVALDLRNPGTSDLTMRLAFQSADASTWFVTNLGFDLPAGGAWQTAQFSLAEGNLTRVVGAQSYASTFSDVSQMRIVHAAGLAFQGDSVVGTLLVDNITAVPEPAATAVFLALTAAGTAIGLRRLRR